MLVFCLLVRVVDLLTTAYVIRRGSGFAQWSNMVYRSAHSCISKIATAGTQYRMEHALLHVWVGPRQRPANTQAQINITSV